MEYRRQVMNTVNKMPYYIGSEKINQPQNVWNMSSFPAIYYILLTEMDTTLPTNKVLHQPIRYSTDPVRYSTDQ